MGKINNILNELNLNEVKYTKVQLKKDIENNKIVGTMEAPVESNFIPVQMSDKVNTVTKDGVLYLGTAIVKEGDLDTKSYSADNIFKLRYGGVYTVTLALKK